MRFFLKNFGSIFISLVLAVLVWVAAVREQDPAREAEYTRPIPVAVIPPAAGLINISAVPEAVRLRLLAPESSWNSLTPEQFTATVDLSQQPAGVQTVPVSVTAADQYVKIVEQVPQVVSVNIEPLKSLTLPVTIDVLDSPPLGYINRIPAASPSLVSITGPVSLVDQVVAATAEVFIRNSKENVQVDQVVQARDADGRVVPDLIVNPAVVQLTVPVEQRFGYKDVSVRVNLEGQVAPGYRVSNIRVDPPTLTVVGNPKGLGQIAGLVETAPINLNQATESFMRTVPLNLPDGVTTVLSEQQKNGPEGVQVTVDITPIEDGVNLQRPITQQGIDPDYWWRAVPDQASVFLSGPLPQLQSLRASDVEVLVDLFNLAPGVHVLQPTVFKPEGVRLDAIVPDTIEITIGRAVTRPALQEGLTDRYTWRSSPNNVNVRLSGDANRLKLLQPREVDVRLNLEGLQPGVYAVTPAVTVPDGLTVDSLLPQTVNVTIELKPELRSPVTVTATVSPANVTPPAKKETN